LGQSESEIIASILNEGGDGSYLVCDAC